MLVSLLFTALTATESSAAGRVVGGEAVPSGYSWSRQGDFGGPLSCLIKNSWYVHGVASFVSGLGCNAPQKPTAFTRVSAYVTWMYSVMNKP